MRDNLSLEISVWLVIASVGFTATVTGVSAPSDETTPEWAKKAIWYQIFVERFRNGDTANDPTLRDMKGSWPHAEPYGWKPTPWTHDWYEQEAWAAATGQNFYYTVQLRRYGGDLRGAGAVRGRQQPLSGLLRRQSDAHDHGARRSRRRRHRRRALAILTGQWSARAPGT